MKKIFKYDFYRQTGEEFKKINFLIKFFSCYNVRFLYFYRNMDKSIFYKLIYKKISKKNGLEIFSKNIGQGLYIGHPYCITVNPDSIIGKNCNLHKGVTIGQENRGNRMGAPIIGNEVWIGVNSTIVGKIKIGDDVLIAPNSYINCDIPSHSIVIGNPCKVYNKNDSTEGYINNRV